MNSFRKLENLDPTLLNDVGFELSSLARAVRYQHWVYRTVAPYLGNRILEIGAGIGNMSQWLPSRERLILTEVDPGLMKILLETSLPLVANDPRVTTQSLDIFKDDLESLKSENLDTVVSFNVLVHIEDDSLALRQLYNLLKDSKAPGPKRLVTFVPAHSWAYGSMDRSFGHYRRYSQSALKKLCDQVAPGARVTLRHFNLFGLLGWYITGVILRRKSIGTGPIETFEKLCPVIAPLDDFLHKTFKIPLGQSLLSVIEWD